MKEIDLQTRISNFPQFSNRELIIEKFLQSLDIKPQSQETYQRQLRVFTKWLVNSGQSNPSTKTILDYKQHLVDAHYEPTTINGLLTAVKQFFKWLSEVNLFPDIAKKIKLLKIGSQFRKDCLSVEQIQQLISSIKSDSIEDARDRAIIILLAHTGLRTIEIQRAVLCDIRTVQGKSVLWVQGKGSDSKDQFVILTETVLQAIRNYLSLRACCYETSPLFMALGNRGKSRALTTRSIRGIVKSRLKKIGIESSRITAHSLRHSSITISLLSGNSVQEVQSFARHKNINTTLIYSHNIDRMASNSPENNIERVLKVA